jgi:hypothetical protein
MIQNNVKGYNYLPGITARTLSLTLANVKKETHPAVMESTGAS